MKRSGVLFLLVFLFLFAACEASVQSPASPNEGTKDSLLEAQLMEACYKTVQPTTEEPLAGVRGQSNFSYDELIAGIKSQKPPFEGAYYYIQPQSLPEYESYTIQLTSNYIRYEFELREGEDFYRVGFAHHKTAKMPEGPLAYPGIVEADERYYEIDGFVVEDTSRIGETPERMYVYWQQNGIDLSAALPAGSSEEDIRHLSKVQIIAVQGIESVGDDESDYDVLDDPNWEANGNSISIVVDGVTEPEIVDSKQNVILRQGEELYKMIDGVRVRAGTAWRIGDHRIQYAIAPDSYTVRMDVLPAGTTSRVEVLVMAFEGWYTQLMMIRYADIQQAEHLVLYVNYETAKLVDEGMLREIAATSIADQEELDKMNKDRAQ